MNLASFCQNRVPQSKVVLKRRYHFCSNRTLLVSKDDDVQTTDQTAEKEGRPDPASRALTSLNPAPVARASLCRSLPSPPRQCQQPTGCRDQGQASLHRRSGPEPEQLAPAPSAEAREHCTALQGPGVSVTRGRAALRAQNKCAN